MNCLRVRYLDLVVAVLGHGMFVVDSAKLYFSNILHERIFVISDNLQFTFCDGQKEGQTDRWKDRQRDTKEKKRDRQNKREELF